MLQPARDVQRVEPSLWTEIATRYAAIAEQCCGLSLDRKNSETYSGDPVSSTEGSLVNIAKRWPNHKTDYPGCFNDSDFSLRIFGQHEGIIDIRFSDTGSVLDATVFVPPPISILASSHERGEVVPFDRQAAKLRAEEFFRKMLRVEREGDIELIVEEFD